MDKIGPKISFPLFWPKSMIYWCCQSFSNHPNGKNWYENRIPPLLTEIHDILTVGTDFGLGNNQWGLWLFFVISLDIHKKSPTVYLHTVKLHTWNTETECIVSRKSHKRKVESMLHVATNLWVGWQATWVSSRSCPANDCKRAPLSTLYKLAVLKKQIFCFLNHVISRYFLVAY